MKRRALLLLGANLGDRADSLKNAISGLNALDGVRVLKCSRIYETAPVGPSDKPYLNQAVEIKTVRTAMGLLLEAKRLESLAGRRPGIRWGARALDVDLVTLGTERVRTPWLRVPHPLMRRRDFARAPLADLSRDWDARKLDPRIVKLWRHGR